MSDSLAKEKRQQMELQNYPNVHAAYEIYMKYFDAAPENATQLVKWCKKQGIVDIKYANVNKYLRLKRDHHAANKVKKPVVKHSTERIRNPELEKLGTVSQFSKRFLDAMEESKKSKSTKDFKFDKGQTRSEGFNAFTQRFEKIMAEEKKVASESHTAYRKRKESEIRAEEERLYKQRKIEHEVTSELEDVLDDSLVNALENIETANYDSDDIGTDDDFEQDDFQHFEPPVNVKPWLRLKPYWTPDSRMAADSPQLQELRQWLEKKKFGQFADKLVECGVETLDDLRILQTEEEVTELAGPDGINMGVVFRRKFIKAVMALRSQQPPPEIPAQPQSKPKQQSQKNPVKRGLTREEQEALNSLVNTIKSHTNQLRKSREDLANIKQQGEDARTRIAEIFDKAMTVLVLRRKTLTTALDRAEEQTTKQLKQRVLDLQTSAKELLKCKQTIEQKFKSTPTGPERQKYVTDAVQQSLDNVPREEKVRDVIVFEEGEPGLIEFVENYGTIGAGRKKGDEDDDN